MARGAFLEGAHGLVDPIAAWVYRYRLPSFAWFIEGHHRVRTAFLRALPGLVRRDAFLTERSVEIPFVLRHLRAAPGSRVLDLGSASSLTPVLLAASGFRVCAVDLEPYPLANPAIARVIADLRRLGFRDGSFAAATAVSTVEHLGLGAYGDARSEAGDRGAITEIHRVLRPGGQLLLTVPFGRPDVSNLQRSYDRDGLMSLLDGFEVRTLEFFRFQGDAWIPGDLDSVRTVQSADRTRAVALVDALRIS